MTIGIVASSIKSSLPLNTRVPNSAYNIIVSFAAALGGFLFGYEIGMTGRILSS